MSHPLALTDEEVTRLVADYRYLERAGAQPHHAIEDLAAEYNTSEVVVWDALIMRGTVKADG
jgi:hypothetical protein